MKVENILYFWLSPIRKNKFSKIFFGHQVRKNKFRKICLFETLHPQKTNSARINSLHILHFQRANQLIFQTAIYHIYVKCNFFKHFLQRTFPIVNIKRSFFTNNQLLVIPSIITTNFTVNNAQIFCLFLDYQNFFTRSESYMQRG